MPPHEAPPITEEQYWRDYELIDNSIHAAIVCCYTHRAISYLVATDPEIYARVNANAEFWQTTAYSLQNMLFILLSRILSHSRGVHPCINLGVRRLPDRIYSPRARAAPAFSRCPAQSGRQALAE
jgi:hypothetical protein